MQDFEKLGLFYLGKAYDLAGNKPTSELVLYESKDLTTHALCVGMTGSGKTGLGIALLEEAAIDGVPVIAIDPKGDLGNLLLAFPELRPEDFLPWVDPDEASRQGKTREAFAAETAGHWRDGLAAWGQDGARIARYRDAVDLAIYTPGSSAGLPLTVLRSFDAPPAALIDQPEAYRERIASAVSGLLALLSIDADPLSSREHILLSNILDDAWRAGRALNVGAIIQEIQAPPFQKVGVIDLETFYPAKDRFALAMKLNNLIASPGFAAWMEGEPLEVGGLLATKTGKPRVSILSIAHLSDAERMFFVTILLNEVLSWARSRPGTSSLRAVLYMDEIFGYFPSTSNPPSKTPMLTLLKQARAYGLGVVLATQNPVDLDYKGLSNCGTWFLGRLQTQRDKDRVLEGLEGASTASGRAFDRAAMDKALSGLGRRVFVMNNVHDDHPVIFQTRWALSYLRGPLTREQIQSLMAPRKAAGNQATNANANANTNTNANAAVNAPAAGGAQAQPGPGAKAAADAGRRPVVPPDVPEFFLPCRGATRAGESLLYRSAVLGVARLHFADKRSGVDHWEALALLSVVEDEVPAELWAESEPYDDGVPELDKAPEAPARFGAMPSELARAKSYGPWSRALKNYLYRERTLDLWKCPDLKELSGPAESERDFRTRLSQSSRERRDEEVEQLKSQYAPKLATIQEKVRRANERLAREQAQANRSTWDAFITMGSSVLSALLGRKALSRTNVTKAATAARAAGRAVQQHGDVGQAEESLEALQQKYQDLEKQLQEEVDRLEAPLRPDAINLEPMSLRPRKADITIERVVLAWAPWTQNAEGDPEKAY